MASAEHFHWADYVVFVLMLAVSLVIGIYHSCSGGKQKTKREYLLGDRKMSPIPVGISMLFSFMSAILVLGSTAEMYTKGTQWYLKGIGGGLSTVISALIFVPLLYPLKLTSITEYLELRFESQALRWLGTALMIFSQIVYFGVATYAPSTAFEAVTGVSTWIAISCVGLIATLYTTMGGIKAVVWADVFQGTVMLAGIIAILIVGLMEVGSFNEVWAINQESNRIKFFDFDPDPTIRATFWSAFIGGMVGMIPVYVANQAAVQRFSSMPTLTKAKMSVMFSAPGMIILYTIACMTGIVVFAYFTKLGCDPMANGDVKNPNQLLVYFLMRVLAYPCVPGLFVAAIFAGAMSSVSSSVSAMACMAWQDVFIRKFGHISEEKQTRIIKALCLIFGLLGTGMAYGTQYMGGPIVQSVASFYQGSLAPMMGVILLGALFPMSNWIGGIAGTIIGFAISMWIPIGTSLSKLPQINLPSVTTNCTNVQVYAAPPILELDGIENMYTISFIWVPAIGILVTLIVGLVVSLITNCCCHKRRPVSRQYMLPLCNWCYCCLPKSTRAKYIYDHLEYEDAIKENKTMDEEKCGHLDLSTEL